MGPITDLKIQKCLFFKILHFFKDLYFVRTEVKYVPPKEILKFSEYFKHAKIIGVREHLDMTNPEF